jgi:CheY-like chemotaxis protein
MNRVVEADFLPRGSDSSFSWPDSRGATPSADKRRILVVASDTGIARLIQVLLERSGPYLVLGESDPARACQSAQTFKPHLILLDIAPTQNPGTAIAAQFQDDPDLRKIPILFLPALTSHSEAARLTHERAFLSNPGDLVELLGAIQKYLPAQPPH